MDIMADEMHERLQNGEDVARIDVREPYEHEEFNIGGTLVPLGSLPVSLEQLPEDKSLELVTYCRSGGRSGMAKQFLEQSGYTNVRNLVGGMNEYQRLYGEQ